MQISVHQEHTRKIERQFDKVASNYETNRLSSWYKAHAQLILEILGRPQDGTIMDIGCASGWFLREFQRLHKNINGIGIDISIKMIGIAKENAQKEKIYNLDFINGDWETLDLSIFREKKISTIICASTLHYFKNPQEAIRRAFETLNEGGRFLLLERDKAGSFLTAVWDKLHKIIIKDQVKFYSSSELIALIKSVGFLEVSKVKQIKRFFWKNKLYTSIVIISGLKL